MSLPITELSVVAVETIFSLTTELKKSISIDLRLDADGTSYDYDPVTGQHAASSPLTASLTVADTRILGFKDDERIRSNGAITPNTRKVFFRYVDLAGNDIHTTDSITLPDGQTAEISSVKFIPDEFAPVFVKLIVEGVNK
jgi:hypothetical protein